LVLAQFFLVYKAFNPPVSNSLFLKKKKNWNVRLCKICF
jgi:hypothetical protein